MLSFLCKFIVVALIISIPLFLLSLSAYFLQDNITNIDILLSFNFYPLGGIIRRFYWSRMSTMDTKPVILPITQRNIFS